MGESERNWQGKPAPKPKTRAMKREVADKADSVAVGLRLPTALRNKIRRLADADGRSMSNYIQRVLEKATK